MENGLLRGGGGGGGEGGGDGLRALMNYIKIEIPSTT